MSQHLSKSATRQLLLLSCVLFIFIKTILSLILVRRLVLGMESPVQFAGVIALVCFWSHYPSYPFIDASSESASKEQLRGQSSAGRPDKITMGVGKNIMSKNVH